MRKKRVLVLMHENLVPPDIPESEVKWDNIEWATEFDVINQLRKQGHEAIALGVVGDLKVIRKAIDEHKPHIVFNLLEEFDGNAVLDSNVVSYLELIRMPYTGSNPRGLILARDKALCKKILRYHRIAAPEFIKYRRGQRMKKPPKSFPFPAIVKCLDEEASLGLSQASVVNSVEKLYERAQYVFEKYERDAIAEEFIEGQEYFVGVLGNDRLQAFPPYRLVYKNVDNANKMFYTERAKFNQGYRDRLGVDTEPANDLSPELVKRIQHICKRAYSALELTGYARMDLRITTNERVYLIEANPNPDIAKIEDFAASAADVGLDYGRLLDKILKLGLANAR